MLDESGSVGSTNWPKMQAFVNDVAACFEVGNGASQSRIGVGKYSDGHEVVFGLDAHSNLASVTNAVNAMTFNGGSTKTGSGIKMVKDEMLNSNGRVGVPRIVVVVTDGDSNDDEKKWSDQLRMQRGAIVFAIGVGNYQNFQGILRDIASQPHQFRISNVNSYGSLVSSVKMIAQTVCAAVNEAIVKPKPVIPKCSNPVDLTIVLDESGSIQGSCYSSKGKDQCWKDMLDFTSQLVDSFNIGTSDAESRVVSDNSVSSLSLLGLSPPSHCWVGDSSVSPLSLLGQ